MADLVRHPRAYDLTVLLAPLADQARVEDAYWITTPDGEYISNNGNEWCHTCGTAKVRNLRRRDRRRADDYRLDGGWTTGHDTPPHCAHCGVKLRAYLHFCGAVYELDHFRDNPPKPGNADLAYEVSEMLSALEYTRREDTGVAEEAIAIAEALVAQTANPEPTT
jgi:hypothetical protein